MRGAPPVTCQWTNRETATTTLSRPATDAASLPPIATVRHASHPSMVCLDLLRSDRGRRAPRARSGRASPLAAMMDPLAGIRLRENPGFRTDASETDAAGLDAEAGSSPIGRRPARRILGVEEGTGEHEAGGTRPHRDTAA